VSGAARASATGRFAPSPTGPLHFGSLVAAIASAVDARASGARWIVRIEDVDEPRAVPGAERDILSTLARYGFAHDGGIVRQSERAERYALSIGRLDARGWLYACACTRRDLESAPLAPSGERVYPGTCRRGVPPGRTANALRVRVGAEPIAYVDRLQGMQRQDLASEVGDFVVRRADGLAAYQLAVVVDDAAQGVTSVVRGADLLASTPRQIHLQHALGLPTPSYLHVPVAIDASGEKLSKQTHARALPDDPLPALRDAWDFLDQPRLDATTVAEFWARAIRAWTPSRLPPVKMLPAPRTAYPV
jgi:glutamyl-Q tRNA(Asp) synthetase